MNSTDTPQADATPEVVAVPTAWLAAAEPTAPAPREVTLLEATFHVSLWTEPTPLYVCLLCTGNAMDHAAVVEHLTTVHSAEAVPTPLAADYLARNPLLMSMTQQEESDDGGEPDREPSGERGDDGG